MKTKAIIVDIDGTLADIGHRLEHIKKKPADWVKFYSKMHLDKPKEDVVEVIRKLSEEYFVLFVTGRIAVYKAQTLMWLDKYVVGENLTYGLYMRPSKDYRPDVVIKEEIYKRDIEPIYNVVAVFEDRTRVVDMWRRLGLTCFQVDSWEEKEGKTNKDI